MRFSIKLLLLLAIGSIRCYSDVSDILERLNEMVLESNLQYSRNTNDNSQIWQEYEFETGAGNRDELVVTGINIRENPTLSRNITDWQYLEVNGVGYLVGIGESILYLDCYKNGDVTSRVVKKVLGRISTFKLVGSLYTLSNDLVVILCVESNNGTNLLWYRISGNDFKFFWSWPVLKRVKRLEHFQHDGQNKLLLLNEAKFYLGKFYSSIVIYGFSVDDNLTDFWLCQRLIVPQIHDFRICPIHESMIIALQGENQVMLYEFENDATREGLFKQFQNIKANSLRNVVCFESGYLGYLAISGVEAGLFMFLQNDFMFDVNSEQLFDDIGGISWIQNVPVDTYRDESLLLVQMRNSTVIGLAWGGHDFQRISLPDIDIGFLDLSKIIVIPRFGFAFENKFVKFETKLRDLPRPMRDEMEEMLQMENKLEEVLLKQDLILNETEAQIGNSYFKNHEITGFWNLSEVETQNVTMRESVVHQSVSVGSKNFTIEDLQPEVNVFNEKLEDLNSRDQVIESILRNAIPANSTTVRFSDEIEIHGNFEIKGTLRVTNLTFDFLNEIGIVDLSTNFVRYGNDVTIKGQKSFPSVDSKVLNVAFINGVPFENIVFDSTRKNYENIVFSKLSRLVVNGNLNFTTVNGIEWNRMKNGMVLKNFEANIDGLTEVEGEIVADNVNVNILNQLRYPLDYILQNETSSANMTGEKTFDALTVANFLGIENINGIPFDDFVKLDGNQTLSHEITFESLEVIKLLQIDCEITGGALKQDEPFNLNESRIIYSDSLFSNLHVLGDLLIERSVNGRKWSDYDDLLLKSEDEVEITGRKTFLGNVNVCTKCIINSQKINGHLLQEFVTLDTEQEFPHLKRISADVSFGQLKRNDLMNLENVLRRIVDDNGNTSCSGMKLVSNQPLVIEALSFETLNGNISKYEFFERLNRTLQQVHFENLRTKELLVKVIVPQIVNGVEFLDFEKRRVSISTPQNLTGDFEIEHLETTTLNAQFVNGIPVEELPRMKTRFDALLDRIFTGNVTINSLTVTGTVMAKTVNGQAFEEMYSNAKTIVFEKDVFVENLTVRGLVNGLNLVEYFSDAVLRTDTDILITGTKTFDEIRCQNLEVSSLNGRSVDAILDPKRDQLLTGPVVVKGSVEVGTSFDSSGRINDIRYADLVDRFRYLENDTYQLHGHFKFGDDVKIKNLTVNGSIQGVSFDNFSSTIVFLGSDDVTISGSKVFQRSVTFERNLTISESFNDVDLTEFYDKAVFIDEFVNVSSNLVFRDDVVVEERLIVGEHLATGTIAGVDINELKESVVYLNVSSNILGSITFANAVFKANMTIERLNDIDMNSLIPLHQEQIITEPLTCVNVTVGNLEFDGLVNGHDLNLLKRHTFMLTGDQNIIGNITFRGNVHVRLNFNVRFINDVDISRAISLDGNDILIGTFVFEKPLVLNGSLRVLGLLNDVDTVRWEALAVTTSFPIKQIISGSWNVHGNVHFEGNVLGMGLLNGIDVRKMSDDLEKRHLELDSIVAGVKMDLDSMCQDMIILQKCARNQIYKFKFFEYLQIFNFDRSIASAHHFETDGVDYLLVNFENCRIDAFLFDGTDFVMAMTVSDFGLIDRWITLTHENVVYFLTVGKVACGRNTGNLWKFENKKFTHFVDLGNVTSFKKVEEDSFLILTDRTLERWSIDDIDRRSPVGRQKSYLSTNESAKFISNHDRVLLASERSIYEYDVKRRNFTTLQNHFGSGEILSFKTGIFRKDILLYYDENVTDNYVFIFNNDLVYKEIQQTIMTYRPKSFLVLNFDGFVENLLIFVENNRTIQIYEYQGVQGFVHRNSIKMKVDVLFDFRLRKQSKFLKKHCLCVIHDNRLIILEARMDGERLDMNNVPCND